MEVFASHWSATKTEAVFVSGQHSSGTDTVPEVVAAVEAEGEAEMAPVTHIVSAAAAVAEMNLQFPLDLKHSDLAPREHVTPVVVVHHHGNED